MSEAAEGAQSATKRKARGKAGPATSGSKGAPAGTIVPALDADTAAALTLYNTYLVADREQQAHERALKKAEKAKDDAAAAVRKLNDRKAPAAETAEAEARYREAAEALQRLRDGDARASEDTPEDDDNADDGAVATTDGNDSTTEETEDSTTEETEDSTTEETEDSTETADEPSVGVEASVGDEDLAGDEPASVAG